MERVGKSAKFSNSKTSFGMKIVFFLYFVVIGDARH